MKKYIYTSLFILNIIIVALLIFISSCIFLTTKNDGIMGYTCHIISDDSNMNKFIIVKETNGKLTPDELFLIRDDVTNSICRLNSINGNLVSCTDITTKQNLEFNITSVKHIGHVKFSSEPIGKMLTSINKNNSAPLLVVLIIGICLLSFVSLAIVYMIHLKKQVISIDTIGDSDLTPIISTVSEIIPNPNIEPLPENTPHYDVTEPDYTDTVAQLNHEELSVDDILESLEKKYGIFDK